MKRHMPWWALPLLIIIGCALFGQLHLLVPTAKAVESKQMVTQTFDVYQLGIKLLDKKVVYSSESQYNRYTYRYEIPISVGQIELDGEYPRVTLGPSVLGTALLMHIQTKRRQYAFLVTEVDAYKSRVEVYVGSELRAVYDGTFSWTEKREVVE